ncbi:MAG: 2-amino-4-hydroxy-6-hydroxymethyldihydropteridine diphosphokinase [Burkholderiaceae bacterium]
MKRAAYIALGANQGDTRDTFAAALDSLASLEQSELVAVSPYYRTAPIDAEGPDYLNAVARLDTRLEPYALLLHLLELELMLGRKRHGVKRNAPRSVDLDLLLHGDLCIQSTPLTLPHPRAHLRAFVLRPLADIEPELVIPGRGRVIDLLAQVADQRIEAVTPLS